VFTKACEKKGSFPSADRRAERQVQRDVVKDENIIDIVQRNSRIITRRISVRLRVPRVRVWRSLHTDGMYPYRIQRIQHLEPADMCSRLELCRWIIANPHMIHNISFFSDVAHFTGDGIHNTRKSHLWDCYNPHGNVKSNNQHRFSVNEWCGVIGEHLIDPYIFPQRLTGDIYAMFCNMNWF
jgi:hypothetical protein